MECEEYGEDGKRSLAAFHASTPSRSKKTTSLASLRTRRERPRGRAAECGQQLPPSDGDCHTPLPRARCVNGRISRHERAVPNSAAPGAGEAGSVRALPRKERARQWRIVPAYAPAGIGDHLQRNMGRRKGVIEELALTR